MSAKTTGIALILILLASSGLSANQNESLQKTLDDYIGLYTKETLDQCAGKSP